ncbi:MAG: tetratricopeptide repeat protein [Alphaproteobacteria bacterium]
MPSPPPSSTKPAPDAIAVGLDLLRAGRAGEAEQQFRRVLERVSGSRDAMNGLALALAAGGDREAALPWLRRAIGDGAVPATWHANHGMLLRQLGRDGEAAAAFRAAVARDARNPAHAMQLGDALLAAGDTAGAISAYRSVVAAAPASAAAWNNLGNALDAAGAPADAVEAYETGIARSGALPETLVNLGNALGKVDRGAEALAAFERAAALRPGFVPALVGRGVALHRLGRTAEALDALDAAIAAEPGSSVAHNNRGICLQAAGRLEEAVDAFRRAIALAPGDPAPLNNLGSALQKQGAVADAVGAFRAALALRPAYPEALTNLGNALEASGEADEAIAAYRAAITADAGFVRAHDNLGNLLQALGRPAEADAVFAAAVAAHPTHLPVRLHAAIGRLRVAYRDMAECHAARAAYARGLAEVAALPLPHSVAGLGDAVEALGANQPFYLAYQGENDRDLQAVYGRFACRVMAARHPEFARPLPRRGRAPGERIRVGILSGFFRLHSNWKVPIRSWIEDLDPAEFAVHGYYTQAIETAETRQARGRCARFVEGARTVEAWAETIRADCLHALLIPEIGMDPTTVRLAALRLAPVQATSWGHPQTSGMPTIDDFLSSDLMEPADGQDHYTERLVRLPGLSFRHAATGIVPEAVTRAELAVEEEAVVYWCCQSLYKYLPCHDGVFARIAAAVPQARFLFLGHPVGTAVTGLFRERLAAAFAGAGLSFERHCRILGTLTPERFAGVTRVADVFLDSIGWSGCNSTLDALDADLPVVTWPGALMRARHSAAILGRIGLTATIAASAQEYVALAIRLGGDPAWRAEMRRRIAAGKAVLRDDPASGRGLAAYLRAAAA